MLNTSGMIQTPVVTIDDCTQLAGEGLRLFQKLAEYLHMMEKYKYPLGLRKGVQFLAGENKQNAGLHARTRTYSFEIHPTRDGKKYLEITETRFQSKTTDHKRMSIIVFPEQAQQFSKLVFEMTARLV